MSAAGVGVDPMKGTRMFEPGSKTERIGAFVSEGVWRTRLRDLPRGRMLLMKALRALLVAGRRFIDNRCTLQASSLTFYSLLSIVPVLAMAFGVAKGFGLQRHLRSQLLETFAGQEAVLVRAIEYADVLLESTKAGMIAGVGVAVLLWSVMRVLWHIESSFNEIWEVTRPRPLGRRFSNYLSIILISPVVVIISGSLTVFISAQVSYIFDKLGLLGVLSPVLFLALKLLSYALIWALLAFVYITVPHTRVRPATGVAAAVAAGTMYQLLQWIYINFQIGISKYNAIYGSFAALPLFLIWLQLSWVIVIFGAELSFALQNVDRFELEPDARRAGPGVRKLLCLLITQLVVKDFVLGRGAVSWDDISGRLDIPHRLTREILGELKEAGVLGESGNLYSGELFYQPARATDTLTIEAVLEALDERGAGELPMQKTSELGEITRALETFRETLKNSPANRLLRDV